MRQRFLLALLVVLGLGVLSVVYAGTLQDQKNEKTGNAVGMENSAADKADRLAGFMSSLKQEGIVAPRAQLELIQERLQADPTLLDDPKVAMPLYKMQTNLVIDMVNAENLSGPERLTRLDAELAALAGQSERIKAEYRKGGVQ